MLLNLLIILILKSRILKVPENISDLFSSEYSTTGNTVYRNAMTSVEPV